MSAPTFTITCPRCDGHGQIDLPHVYGVGERVDGSGFGLSCNCGWDGGTHPTRSAAGKAGRAHVRSPEPLLRADKQPR